MFRNTSMASMSLTDNRVAADPGQVQLKKKTVARPKLSDLQGNFAALTMQDQCR